MAGVYADILAEKLELNPEDRELVVRAAILHDWYKKHEALAIKSAIAAGDLSLELLLSIKAQDAQKLQEMGFSDQVIALTGANVPENSYGPHTLPSMIVWYVDAILSHTDVVDIQQRFKDLQRGWDGKVESEERAKRNNQFSQLFAEKYSGAPLYKVQRKIGKRISRKFAELLHFDGPPSQLPRELTRYLEDRILNGNTLELIE